jgi:5-methylcytosine-specific restriction endonuclease McrA
MRTPKLLASQARALRERLFELQGGLCYYCKVPMTRHFDASSHFFDTKRPLAPTDATLEHLVPRCEGGSNEIDNLAAACHACNNARGAAWPHLSTYGKKETTE